MYFYSVTEFTRPTIQRRSQHSTDTVSEFHAETPQATASERHLRGPYVAPKLTRRGQLAGNKAKLDSTSD